eukprot:NODE_4240_length_839_cov_15.406329_g3914_i0.p1 GENE.NODE_4240_length_839_cov_15.406329_g3914_i0~~NODE_4240_length_839_cov_15.406329_g3914_i0.p1  ORF type:complete len:134 (-),score=26.15 NODE_4240_length_839_cov_15.406329_g3914_i0:282-683(-)
MSGRMRSRDSDWNAGSPFLLGGKTLSHTTTTRRDYEFLNICDKDSLAQHRLANKEKSSPEKSKSSGVRNPMYQTANSQYGVGAASAQAPISWHGKSDKFSTNHIFVGRTGINTELDKSRVGPNPQFGVNPYEM